MVMGRIGPALEIQSAMSGFVSWPIPSRKPPITRWCDKARIASTSEFSTFGAFTQIIGVIYQVLSESGDKKRTSKHREKRHERSGLGSLQYPRPCRIFSRDAEGRVTARFAQVAISVADKETSLAYYRDLFGLTPVGGTHFSGKATEQVQGMAGASSNCSWLMDDRPYFQFEIFQFDCPLGRATASNRQPQDIGYSRLIFSVPALAPVAARAGVDIHELHGQRTAYLRDADGIALQIIEAGVPQARLTGVALSVSDLKAAKRSFVDGCGCVPLSAPARDWGEVWGETGADKDMLLLDGGTLTLELSQYRTPVSRGWPDGYQIADHGILNIALGFDSPAAIRAQLVAMQAVGIKPNAPLETGPGLFALTYSQDPQGFSIETIYVSKLAAGAFGFRNANLFDRALMAIMKAAS
jgi:catechol 2,3-dioxygenase-like lactoylglutathione lyase family enzyme